MPKPTSKSRQELRSRFVRNAIPTEADFADLIAASLNQADDGVLKLPDQPLGLVRQKPDQPVLRFFADPAAEGSVWQVQLGSGDKPGFGLAAADGKLALFVDGATGNVGIGVGAKKPEAALHIAGNLKVEAGSITLDKDQKVFFTDNGQISSRDQYHQLLFRSTENITELREWGDLWFSAGANIENTNQPKMIVKHNGLVGIGTAMPFTKLQVTGNVSITSAEGQNFACRNYHMAPGSLTIGGIDRNYGGGTHWNDNTAGLLLETLDNTEIAIHDSKTRLASFMYYESANNRFTIGRDMGWGAISAVNIQGSLQVNGSIRCSSISGPANLIQKAHFSLKGGGLITWSNTNRLSWNRRFIAIGFGTANSSSHGYFNILGPTMPGFGGLESWDGSNRIQDASVELRDWESLYAIMTGIGPNDVRLRIENYQQQGELSSNWLLIASRNGDDGTLKLGIGPSVSPGQSISYGSPIPCGTIVMWSGKPEDIPVGWFICDGSNGTPDLRGRFILGSGKGSGLTLRDLKQPMGGREAIALGTNELPKHRHGITDPKHSHTWSLSRQLQGIDDKNYTSELSKGDAGAQDSLQVGTTSVGTGIEINDAGAGAAFDIMPPFYILIFIMKGFVS